MKQDVHITELLPGYALNCLDAEEVAMAAEHLIVCEQCREEFDVISKAKFKFPTGWARNFNSDMNTILCSRQLLEYTIRQEILEKYFNVKIVENARVIATLEEGVVV